MPVASKLGRYVRSISMRVLVTLTSAVRAEDATDATWSGDVAVSSDMLRG